MKTVHILGNGGHAKAVADLIQSLAEFSLGYFVVKTQADGSDEISEKDFLDRASTRDDCLAMGIGGIRSLDDRFSIYKKFATLGYEFPPLISPFACVSKSAQLGLGSVIFPFSNIGPGASVGEAGICNTGSNLEHGSSLGYGSHLSTSATVNGDCSVGSLTFVGSNATLEQGVVIPEKSFIKMGTLVTRQRNTSRFHAELSDLGGEV